MLESTQAVSKMLESTQTSCLEDKKTPLARSSKARKVKRGSCLQDARKHTKSRLGAVSKMLESTKSQEGGAVSKMLVPLTRCLKRTKTSRWQDARKQTTLAT